MVRHGDTQLQFERNAKCVSDFGVVRVYFRSSGAVSSVGDITVASLTWCARTLVALLVAGLVYEGASIW
jgi:hypothetical protein